METWVELPIDRPGQPTRVPQRLNTEEPTGRRRILSNRHAS